MWTPARSPAFSVIIPTRNRSAVFLTAVRSVLRQSYECAEVIIVDDGSIDEEQTAYQRAVSTESSVELVRSSSSERGHGPSFSRNVGADAARGDYLCFLDDDDEWTDRDYLNFAARVIESTADHVDLVLADQRAFREGKVLEEVIWIEDLQHRINEMRDATGAVTVSVTELLKCVAHCHLNTTIVSRHLFNEIGGFDEGLRYEEDRDFYLRAIDRARLIKYIPKYVSRHNIPPPGAIGNLSTAATVVCKRLYQLRVFDKASILSSRPELRYYAMRQRSYTLKHIANLMAMNGVLDGALHFALQGLAARFTLGWLVVTLRLVLRRGLEPVLCRIARLRSPNKHR